MNCRSGQTHAATESTKVSLHRVPCAPPAIRLGPVKCLRYSSQRRTNAVLRCEDRLVQRIDKNSHYAAVLLPRRLGIALLGVDVQRIFQVLLA